MDILFLYPAKAYLVEATRKARLLEYAGYTFAAFDGLNVYVKTGEHPRFAYEECAGWSHYAMQVAPDVYVLVTNGDSDSHFIEKTRAHSADFLAGIVARAKAVLADMEGHNARLKVETEARNEAQKAEAVIRERARLAHDAEKAAQAEQAQLEAEARFKAGERISWPAFEAACKKYGVEMAISTIGSGRKRVNYIGQSSASISGKRPLGDGIWRALRSLKEQLNEVGA